MKKKFVAILMATLLVCAFATNVSAYDFGAYSGSAASNYSGWLNKWVSFWSGSTDQNAEDTSDPVETVTLEAPTLKTTTYCHTNNYVPSLNQTLQVTWSAVDGAESYEIEITKSDGTSKVYTSDANCLLIYSSEDNFAQSYPHGSVRVRAVAGASFGAWSESKKIGCSVLFHAA